MLRWTIPKKGVETRVVGKDHDRKKCAEWRRGELSDAGLMGHTSWECCNDKPVSVWWSYLHKNPKMSMKTYLLMYRETQTSGSPGLVIRMPLEVSKTFECNYHKLTTCEEPNQANPSSLLRPLFATGPPKRMATGLVFQNTSTVFFGNCSDCSKTFELPLHVQSLHHRWLHWRSDNYS